MTDSEWGFADADDARKYLGEVGRVWAVWVAGVFFLMSNNGWVVIIGGLVVVSLLVLMGRPLQARAAALVPQESSDSPGRWSVLAGKGTQQDRMLRKLAYGKDPLNAAVAMAGASPLWKLAQSAVIALTVAGLVFVALEFMTGSGSG